MNWDDRMHFSQDRSKASVPIKDIKSFIFGGFSSRFWLLRKHIISMDRKQLLDLPFFCWECITIVTDYLQFNLIINDQFEMTKLIEFLIVSLRTIDGRRDSMLSFIEHYSQEQEAKLGYPLNEEILNNLKKKKNKSKGPSSEFEKNLYLGVFRKFNMLRVRMKLSYMAIC